MLELDRIYHDDCLTGMEGIADGTIDCIITDLPYGVLNKQSEGGRWDDVIPLEPLWRQFLRVAKEEAAIILFSQGMFTAEIMKSQPAIWRYNIIWHKDNRPTGFLNAKVMPMKIHEDICVFYRRQPTYNPQMTRGLPNHKRTTSSVQGQHGCYGAHHCTPSDMSGNKYPTDVIVFAKEHDDERFHPTQKPVDLLRYLVLTYTDEGNTVLDACMGSGTTAVACVREKRHFIGFETDEDYYNKAKARIKTEMAQPTLF